MKKVFIVSLCEGCESSYYRFHFKGYYKGVKIHKILVRGHRFERNTAYVLALIDLELDQGILRGKCIKFKKLLN